MRDITLAYGDEKTPQEIEQIARQFYLQMGINVAEFLRMPYMTAEDVNRYATIEGAEYLDAALARGKGVIFCVAHIGNWEMLATVMGRAGYDISAIVRPQADSALTELFNRIRRAHGLQVTNMDEIRAIIRILKRNGGIGLMGDLNSNNPGAFVNFFGRPAASFTGAAYLARLTGAEVISIFEERLPDYRHVVRIGPPIPFVKTEDARRDLLINTMRFTNVIEQEIRRRPQDWFWLANRWKTRPEQIQDPERIPMEHRDLTPDEAREALEAVANYHTYRDSVLSVD
jgi:KDO2-lipid IV(A) lauroyltransferase